MVPAGGRSRVTEQTMSGGEAYTKLVDALNASFTRSEIEGIVPIALGIETRNVVAPADTDPQAIRKVVDQAAALQTLEQLVAVAKETHDNAVLQAITDEDIDAIYEFRFGNAEQGGSGGAAPAGGPWKAQLLRFLADYFSRETDLKKLTFTYFEDVKAEIAWGGSIADQAAELVEALKAHGQLPELWPALRAERDNLVDKIGEIERAYEAAAAVVPVDRPDGVNGEEQLRARAAAEMSRDRGRPPSSEPLPPADLIAQSNTGAAAERSEALEAQAASPERRRGLNQPARGAAPLQASASRFNTARSGPQGVPQDLRASRGGPKTLSPEDLAKLKKRQTRLKAAADALASVTKTLDEALKLLPDTEEGAASHMEAWEDDPAIAVDKVEALSRQIEEAATWEDRYALLNQLLATVLDGIDRAEDQNDYDAMSELAGLAESAYKLTIVDMEGDRLANLLIRATPYWRMKQTYASYEAKRHEG
jgi:hypothetical protein